jgi:hypothetical protein
MLVSANGPGKLESAVVKRILTGESVKELLEKDSIWLILLAMY